MTSGGERCLGWCFLGRVVVHVSQADASGGNAAEVSRREMRRRDAARDSTGGAIGGAGNDSALLAVCVSVYIYNNKLSYHSESLDESVYYCELCREW